MPDAEKAPKALMETEWATRTMGSMALGISPDDVVATIGARITHKCLLISKHTASPITFLLLSREAQSSLLVTIPLQRHLRLDIGLDTFRVKRLTHRSAAEESPRESSAQQQSGALIDSDDLVWPSPIV